MAAAREGGAKGKRRANGTVDPFTAYGLTKYPRRACMSMADFDNSSRILSIFREHPGNLGDTGL